MNKPFTELPRPERTHRLSIVAVWNPIDHPDTLLHCEHTGHKSDEINEISECPVCGRWMCETCFGDNGVDIPLPRIEVGGLYHCPCCDDCSKLTADERQAVMELRERLGGAM